MKRKNCLYLTIMCWFITISAQADSFLESVPIGSWGGEHIGLIVTATGATVEFDCAVGTIEEPITLDAKGNFEVHGKHVFEDGGPLRLGDPSPTQHPVVYRGWTNGNQMLLTVILFETKEMVGTFMLFLNRPPQLEKCL